ncbi:MAG: glycosyl hydrolase family 65 protein, partial [Bacteroidota bacterium]
TENGPVANPNLTPTWKRIQFKLYWRGKRYSFDLKSEVGSVEIKGFILITANPSGRRIVPVNE